MIVPRSLDGFDVIASVERMLDQPMLWWEAVGLFVEHFATWEQSWQESIGDDALERRRVHAVRSAAANVGAKQLAEVAGELEDFLLRRASGDSADVSPDLRQRLRDSFRHAWASAATARRASEFHPGGRACA